MYRDFVLRDKHGPSCFKDVLILLKFFSKYHSLIYHLESHLHKNHFIYLFNPQQLLYILFALKRVVDTLNMGCPLLLYQSKTTMVTMESFTDAG